MAGKTAGPYRVIRYDKYGGEVTKQTVSTREDEKEASKIARKLYLDGAYDVKVLDSNNVESLMWCKPIQD